MGELISRSPTHTCLVHRSVVLDFSTIAGLQLVAVVHGLRTFGADLELIELLKAGRAKG